MKEQTNHRFQLELETITPVSIGNGGVISPLSDYILDSGEIYLINHHKFEQAIGEKAKENDKIISDYIKGVANVVDTAKNDFLKNFITRDLGKKDFRDVCFPNRFQANNINNATEISTCLKNGNQAFISGSTIKGAIKTTLLYDWLVNDVEGKKELNNLIDFLNDEFNKLDDKIKQLFKDRKKHFDIALEAKDKKIEAVKPPEDTKEYKKQKKIQHDNRDLWKGNSTKKIQGIDQQLQVLLEPTLEKIDSKFNEIIGKLFGENSDESPKSDSSLIQISDSQCFNVKDITFYDTKRYHLKAKETTISQVKETIQKGCKQDIIFTLDTIKNKVRNTYLQKILEGEESLTKLFEKINLFSLANIEYESSEVKGSSITVKKYKEFLSSQKKEIKHNSGKTYLRIGSGKTYFSNSVGLAIFKANKDVFQKLREILGLYPMRQQFPITFSIIMDKGIPLGWIRLIDKNFKSKPEHYKGKIKQGATGIEAEVIKSGKPNKVKLYLSKDNEPEMDLFGYSSELKEGSIILVKVNQYNKKKKQVMQVGFEKFKN